MQSVLLSCVLSKGRKHGSPNNHPEGGADESKNEELHEQRAGEEHNVWVHDHTLGRVLRECHVPEWLPADGAASTTPKKLVPTP